MIVFFNYSLTANRLVPIVSQVVKDEQILGLWRGTTAVIIFIFNQCFFVDFN